MHILVAVLMALLVTAAPLHVEAKGGCPARAQQKQAGVYRVSIHKSGGFAGVQERYVIDSNRLDKQERTGLASLVDKSGILSVDNVRKTTANAADLFFYEIKVEHRGKTHTAIYDDMSLPQAYRPLLDYVLKNGTRTKTN